MAESHRLLTVLLADSVGLQQRFRKLVWPTREPGVILGIELNFIEERHVRFALSAERRWALKKEVMAIVGAGRRGTKYVCEAQLKSVVGDLTWGLLVKRPLLSALKISYAALGSNHRPDGQVRLYKQLVDELWLVAGALAFAETTTAVFTDTLWCFDASGKSHLGNGGKGVCYRQNLTQEVAAELTTPFGRERLSQFRVQDNRQAPPERLADPRRARAAARAAQFMQFSYRRGRTIKDWRIAREGEFKEPARIVLKAESLAGCTAYGCASRRKVDRGKLVGLVGDNMGSLYGMVKGRSGKKDLNLICRRLAMLQVSLAGR